MGRTEQNWPPQVMFFLLFLAFLEKPSLPPAKDDPIGQRQLRLVGETSSFQKSYINQGQLSLRRGVSHRHRRRHSTVKSVHVGFIPRPPDVWGQPGLKFQPQEAHMTLFPPPPLLPRHAVWKTGLQLYKRKQNYTIIAKQSCHEPGIKTST